MNKLFPLGSGLTAANGSLDRKMSTTIDSFLNEIRVLIWPKLSHVNDNVNGPRSPVSVYKFSIEK